MKLSQEKFIESRFIAEGEVKINENIIPYKSISEDNVINSDSGKPIGSIFSFSYFRSNIEDSNRPVVFVYNGVVQDLPPCGCILAFSVHDVLNWMML